MTAEERAKYHRDYMRKARLRKRDRHTGKTTCCRECLLKAHREYMAEWRTYQCPTASTASGKSSASRPSATTARGKRAKATAPFSTGSSAHDTTRDTASLIADSAAVVK